ncbi:MAG: hypothetical protein WC685_11165 [Methylobacter sp.]
MTKKFNDKDADLPWAATKALLEKRKLTYTELLDLTAQSLLWVKKRDEENKDLNNLIDEYSLATSQFHVIVEEMMQESLSVFAQMKIRWGMALLDGVEIQKKLQVQKAADNRHSENRSMKAQAIQHYKDNHKSFNNKNDAAFYISKEIVPIAFATIRDWLKGINPE